MRDSRGFMWFGTRDGLSRFDGAQFITYRIDEGNARPGIESLTETSDGSYWITTTGGLYRFQRDAISQPSAENRNRPLLNAEFISRARGFLVEDRSGTLWYASGALYRIERKNGKFSLSKVDLKLPLSPAREPSIVRMCAAADGSLWLDTLAGLIRRLPDGRVIFYHDETNLTGGYRYVIADRANDRIWLLHDLEVFVIKPEPLESLANVGPVTVRMLTTASLFPAATEIPIQMPTQAGEIYRIRAEFLGTYPGHQLYQSSDGHVWLTTNKELIEFDGQVFHRFTTAQGLPEGMLAMAEDSAGNIWVGGTSLARLNRKGLISYGEADGLHSPSISAINEASDGTLYFADADFYINRLNGRSFVSTRPGVASTSRFLWLSHFAFLDSRKQWWILTNEKLYRFSDLGAKPLATYTTRDGLKSNAMFQIFEDRRGNIWVSVQALEAADDGLALFEPAQNRFHTFTEAEGFPPRRSVSSFAEQENGTIWFGFYEGGLARYSSNHFTVFGSTDGLPGGVISDLKLDHLGRLWLSSSGGGVARVDDPNAEKPEFKLLSIRDGLSSNNVRTISEDKLGNIYLGTVRGIDKISATTNVITHYSVGDGLAGDFVIDSHCDRNGVMWFATTSGLSRLPPAAEQSYGAPPIWLGGLRIAGVPQPLPELGAQEVGAIQLAHTQNNVQLDFFGLDFHAGQPLRYQYRLEGADSDWSTPTEQRTITFANLRPGNYRFVVRAINSQGIVSDHPATVSFRILPPIWLRWWFIALALFGVAGLSLAVIRQREARRRERERAQVERLRDLEQVRRRIAADLHDDIGSNLTRISLISEVAQRQMDGTDPGVRAQLNNIAKLSRELVDSMSEIVWAINPRKDHFSDLSQRMRHFASDLLSAKQIHFQFRALDHDHDIKVGANVRREFFLVFKEGINNIARHADCTEVDIELRASDDRLILTLNDNGKGFDVDKGVIGHGLVSMRERTRALGGELEITSTAGQGTSLRFAVPLHVDDVQVTRAT